MTHKPYSPGMTLMPGESTSVSVDLPIPDDGGVRIPLRLVQVPPPAHAQVQDRAKELGLADGLQVTKSHSHGPWRCSQCNHMQPATDEMVMVPDGIRLRDPLWAVTETCRLSAFNGSYSGWCVPCAKKLGRDTSPKEAAELSVDDDIHPALFVAMVIAIVGVVVAILIGAGR